MKAGILIFSCFTLLLMERPMTLFDFSKNADLSNWKIVNDVVMGGRSDADLSLDDLGNGIFSGHVSLENNGGFASLRYRMQQREIRQFQTCKIKLKGDGKRYQFRVKTDIYDRHSYIQYFQTSGDWEIIEIPLTDCYPTFRGRKLDFSNFPAEQLAEIAFLIGNKTAENFQLELDWVRLE